MCPNIHIPGVSCELCQKSEVDDTQTRSNVLSMQDFIARKQERECVKAMLENDNITVELSIVNIEAIITEIDFLCSGGGFPVLRDFADHLQEMLDEIYV